jgi:Rieske Fe-S protein
VTRPVIAYPVGSGATSAAERPSWGAATRGPEAVEAPSATAISAGGFVSSAGGAAVVAVSAALFPGPAGPSVDATMRAATEAARAAASQAREPVTATMYGAGRRVAGGHRTLRARLRASGGRLTAALAAWSDPHPSSEKPRSPRGRNGLKAALRKPSSFAYVASPMTEFERRLFLLWAAGSAAAALSSIEKHGLGAASFLLRGLGETLPESGPQSKPASKPGDVKPGPQEDGSVVFDPASPPAHDLKTKEDPNGFFVKVGSETALVAQASDKSWVAVSAICSHKACTISYKAKDREFRCPCHGSKFSEAGKVKKGPAKDDLTPFAASEVKGSGGKKLVRVAKAFAKK